MSFPFYKRKESGAEGTVSIVPLCSRPSFPQAEFSGLLQTGAIRRQWSGGSVLQGAAAGPLDRSANGGPLA